MSMRLVAASATACLCACLGASGGGAGAARSLGQPTAPLDWATQLLGTPPRSISVVRPYPGSDSLERDESPDPSPADYAIFHSRQADAYSRLGLDERKKDLLLAGDILVLHAVPQWLDPLRPYPRADQPSGWSLVATSPSGIRTYRGTREDHEQPVQLFVLPSSTWILATGVAAQRLGWQLASNAMEPPYLDALPGIFEQTTASVDGAGLAREGKCWVRDCTHVVAAGLATYAPSDRSLAYGAFLMFPDEGSARDAATDAQRLLADPATRERLVGRNEGGERFAGVEAVGRAVVFLTAVAAVGAK